MADLNTLFIAHLVALKAAAPAAQDVATLLAKNLPTMRAAVPADNRDDYNTMLGDYLTP